MTMNKATQAIYQKCLLLVSSVLIIILFTSVLSGQTLERQLISTTGNLSHTEKIHASATSGEIAIRTLNPLRIVLNQGFQQTQADNIVGIIQLDDAEFSLSILPNPTSSSILMKLKSERFLNLNFSVFDIMARRVLPSREISFSGERDILIDFSQFMSGTYLISLKDDSGRFLKTFEVQKID